MRKTTGDKTLSTHPFSLQAKDVTMEKRPLSDMEDPRLNGNFHQGDFECILRVAVFCVAKSSKDRPTIDTFFEELDRAWKNTLEDPVCTLKTHS